MIVLRLNYGMTFSSFSDHLVQIFQRAWDKAPQLLLTFVVGYIVIILVRLLISSLIRVSRAKEALKDMLMSLVNVGLWLFLIAALLQQVGLTQIAFALSGSVAIVGLAISAGSASLVQDLVSGIFLAQDQDFNIGDTLKVGEIEGIVEKMDARKIRIRDNKDLLHVFPNSVLDKSAWIVVKKKGQP